MKVSELIQTIRHYPDAEVKISSESFLRRDVETISTNVNEVTLCGYNLLDLVAKSANARIDDGDEV